METPTGNAKIYTTSSEHAGWLLSHTKIIHDGKIKNEKCTQLDSNQGLRGNAEFSVAKSFAPASFDLKAKNKI